MDDILDPTGMYWLKYIAFIPDPRKKPYDKLIEKQTLRRKQIKI